MTGDLPPSDDSASPPSVPLPPVRVDEVEVIYRRHLPQGGEVRIEATLTQAMMYRAEVRVERRADPQRRAGHAPPPIASFEGPTKLSVMAELYRVAADDALIERAFARWRARRKGP